MIPPGDFGGGQVTRSTILPELEDKRIETR